MRKQIGLTLCCLLAWGTCDSIQAEPPVQTVAMPAAQAPTPAVETWMLHLPGIAGRKWVDEQMALGLADAKFPGTLDIYDWTGEDPGIPSLHAYKRNQAEAQKIADRITTRARQQPGLRIIVSGHSGGTGIVIWALEKMPADVMVDDVVLLASALSPEYDLSKALTHVRGKCYSFCSENDVLVLGAGTKMFGTIDGKKTEAAGEFGFIFPATGDQLQYDKLIQKPYDKAWLQYDNVGNHIGCMLRPFTRHILAPLLNPEHAAAAPEKPVSPQRAEKRSAEHPVRS